MKYALRDFLMSLVFLALLLMIGLLLVENSGFGLD